MKNTPQTAAINKLSGMLAVDINTDTYFFSAEDFYAIGINLDEIMHTSGELEAAIIQLIKNKLGFTWRFIQ